MKDIQLKLDKMKSKNQFRDKFRFLSTGQQPIVIIENKEVLLFGSNNYLGFANSGVLKQVAIEATTKFGTGSGGSRLTTGSYTVSQSLEEEIARFKGAEGCLVLNSGYDANVGIIPAICDKDWVIFCDRNNHASIIDGCLLSGARIVRYKNSDMIDLEKKIKIHKGKKNLIVTDSVFSMQGNIAPLDKIVELAKKYEMMTMVDDAHGFGVIGKNGSGANSHFNLESEVDITVGTLSKSAGSVGGYVVASSLLIDYFRNTIRSFIYTTALPPSSYAVSLKAIELIENSGEKRTHLKNMTDYLIASLKSHGYKVMDTHTSIVAIVIGDESETLRLSESLFENGIYVPAIRPPTVKRGQSILRVTLTAEHTYDDVDKFIGALTKISGERYE